MREVSISSKPDEPLVKKILSVSEESRSEGVNNDAGIRVRSSIDLESMKLIPENIASVVTNKILSVKFFPSADMRMVVAGNVFGDLGFWNIDSEPTKNGDGIYMYHPHSAPMSSICIHPFSINKIITCSYHGFIRTLDVEKEIFDLTYSTKQEIFSMSQTADDVNSLYFREGKGVFRVLDERSKSSSMTSYFSPSGNLLATTSTDDKIGVASGANFDDEFSVYHDNQTGKWVSVFKGGMIHMCLWEI
ncbi:unnamed protein product [Lactuca saligna]|uniref:Uncharacterized protein n=1 Tax=Lactuca saligna TaxID=75948 RepID=A0AA35ZT11_LACSI|nr:unnamed protein product [Lactuca saligna]